MEFIMLEILEAKPLAGYKLWVRFSDGRSGIVDLSHLVGKGVFTAWNDPEAFKGAFLDSVGGTVAWPGDIQLCPDSLYEELTGIRPDAPLISRA
jgi:hypothetical protein